jgi:hypothetical protein
MIQQTETVDLGGLVVTDLRPIGELEDRESRDVNDKRMLGQTTIAGSLFHVDLVRVYDKPEEGGLTQTAFDEGASGYEMMQAFYDEAYETIKVPGHEGDYVMFVHPFGR